MLGVAAMDTREVMQMLIEVERALQRHDCAAAYEGVLEAENELLLLEREFLSQQSQHGRRVAQAPR